MSEVAAEQQQRPKIFWAQKIEDLSEEALMCRDLRHAWQFITDYTMTKRKGQPNLVDRHIQCARCLTERFDTFVMPGFEKLSTRYVYPSDRAYRMYGQGRVPVNDIRAEFFRRRKVVRAVS